MTTSVDRRVCFVGDSFVAGVGDPEHRGWVSRLAAWSHRAGRPLTAYNLGVSRDTSEDVRQRLPTEVASRQAAGCDHRLVVSFGVNDTTVVEGVVRVEPAVSVANLLHIAEHAAAESVPLLVIGPPPVADLGQNKRVAALDGGFAGAAAERGFPYLSVFDALAADPVWMREVRLGDGAHPAAGGYERFAELVQPAWQTWLEQP